MPRRGRHAHGDASGHVVRDRVSMETVTQIVDLADRHSEDLDVVLLWGRQTGRLWVDVTHRQTGRTARVNATATNALDVFHHPFAYAQA